MVKDFEKKLAKYADLIVHIGLNIQPGQRLLIGGKNLSRGAPLASAPLVRKVTESAYKAGARFVNVLWDDDQLHLIRIANAAKDSLEDYPTWRTDTIYDYAKNGDPIFTIFAENPDLYAGQDEKVVTDLQHTMERNLKRSTDLLMRDAYPWTLVSVPTVGWAARVFPDLPAEERMDALWEVIFRLVRCDLDDPVAAWKDHVALLTKSSDWLNAKAFDALHYTGPGTDLTLGLPKGHVWKSAQSHVHGVGTIFMPNLPTEEVFSMPDKNRAEGKVRATMPLNYGGALIEDFDVVFKEGRIVDYHAKKGEGTLKGILDTDDGSRRLGEVALVPNSSPISQSGLLFYNTLFDENASCHIALGRAYQFSMQGGADMSSEEFGEHGGNNSLVHIDFMIGSGEIDIDGLDADGNATPIMRGGEWAFEA